MQCDDQMQLWHHAIEHHNNINRLPAAPSRAHRKPHPTEDTDDNDSQLKTGYSCILSPRCEDRHAILSFVEFRHRRSSTLSSTPTQTSWRHIVSTRFQRITPFLWFHDSAEEAAHFYVSLFENSRIVTSTRYGKEAAQASGKPEGSVMTIAF
jgi:hypothetical protein